MGSDRVEACVDDALADFQRQGYLELADVQRLIDQHHLDGDGASAVFLALRRNDVPLDSESSEPALPATVTGDVPRSGRDTLGLMLRSAGRAKLLTAEEEVLLGRRIHIGQLLEAQNPPPAPGTLEARQIADGRVAHNQLVLANLRLVVSIARRFRPSGMDLSDLIQEGTIGLMRAADKFDHTLGYKFSTYATWWIRQAINRGIANSSRLVRLPVHIMEKLQRISSAQNDLRTALEREPSIEEVAERLDMSPADIRGILDVARDPISLDAPIGDESDADLGAILDLYAADVAEEVADALTRSAIREALSDFDRDQEKTAKGASARAIEMLKLRFGFVDDEEHTLDEIGAAYGVTRERARQILKRTIESPQLKRQLTDLTAEN